MRLFLCRPLSVNRVRYLNNELFCLVATLGLRFSVSQARKEKKIGKSKVTERWEVSDGMKISLA